MIIKNVSIRRLPPLLIQNKNGFEQLVLEPKAIAYVAKLTDEIKGLLNTGDLVLIDSSKIEVEKEEKNFKSNTQKLQDELKKIEATKPVLLDVTKKEDIEKNIVKEEIVDIPETKIDIDSNEKEVETEVVHEEIETSVITSEDSEVKNEVETSDNEEVPDVEENEKDSSEEVLEEVKDSETTVDEVKEEVKSEENTDNEKTLNKSSSRYRRKKKRN